MIKVGITGNIASGKSQVENILINLGYKVVDADKINNELISFDNDIIASIKSLFVGYDILNEDFSLDKKKIGEIVFNNNEYRLKLENILHPKIFEKIVEFTEKNKNESIVFISMALLFETKQENFFDKIILVSAPSQIRLKRLMERNNYSKEQAEIRINSQLDENLKIKKSDFVILNNSDIDNLKKQIYDVLKKLSD